MENSSNYFCHNCSGMTMQNSRRNHFSQYESPNIVIQPTFSFATKGQPPAKKLKLDTECQIVAPLNNSKILRHQSIKKNGVRTCMPTSIANKSSIDNNKNNKFSNSNSSSNWSSNYLHSIGQSHLTVSTKSKIPIVCIPDRGNNDEDAKYQNLNIQSCPTENEKHPEPKIENKDEIDNRVKTLLSTILPKKEVQEKKINIDLNVTQCNLSKIISHLDKSPSTIFNKKPLPSIKKFRIPKIKSNPSNTTNNLQNGKDVQIITLQNDVKNKSTLAKTSNEKQHKFKIKTKVSPPNHSFKSNSNCLSTNTTQLKNSCSVTLRNTDNKRQQILSKEITLRTNKEKRRQISHYKNQERSTSPTCKVTKSSKKIIKPLSSNKLISKIDEKRKTSEVLPTPLKSKRPTETDDTPRYRKYKTNTQNINNNEDLVEVANRINNNPKNISRLDIINRKKDSAPIKSNLKVENKYKSSVKDQNKHKDHEAPKIAVMKGQNCYYENQESSNKYIKVKTIPTRANTNDNYISKTLTIKSVVKSTNNFVQSKTNVKKYPVVEDLRKKLNRAKKRRSIVSKPNTINDQDSSRIKPGQNMQSDFTVPKMKTIKLIVNLICEKTKSKTLKDEVINKDTCQLTNVDLSFLDDFNVDDIVDSLNYKENDCKLANIDSKTNNKMNEHSDSRNSDDNKNIVDVKLHSFVHNKIGGNKTDTVVDRETCDNDGNDKSEIEHVTVPDTNLFTNISFTSNNTSTNKVNSCLSSNETEKEDKNEFTINIVRNEGPITDTFIESRTQPSSNEQSKIECKREFPTDIIVLDEDSDTDTLIYPSTQQTSLQETKINDLNVNPPKNVKTQKDDYKIEAGIIVLDHGSFIEEVVSPNNQQTSNRKQGDNDEVGVDIDGFRSKTKDIDNRNEFSTEIIVVDEESNQDSLIISKSQPNKQDCKTDCVDVVHNNVPFMNNSNKERKNEIINTEIIKLEDEAITDPMIDSNQQLSSKMHSRYNDNNDGLSKLLSIINNISNKKPNAENEKKVSETDETNLVSNSNLFKEDTKSNSCNVSIEKFNQNILSTKESCSTVLFTNKNNSDNFNVKEPERKIHLTDSDITSKTSNKNITTEVLSRTSEFNMATVKTLHDCEYTSTSLNKTKLKVTAEDKITGKIASVRNVKDQYFSTLSNFAKTENGLVISSGKITENVKNRLSNTCKVPEPPCINQKNDTSNIVVKVGNETGKKENYCDVSMGLVKTPYEECLSQTLAHRMLEYLGINYDIGTLIRRGKYSNIFQCTDPKLNKYVVKVLNKEQDRFMLGVQKEKILNDLQKDIPKRNQHIVNLFNGFGMSGRWCFLLEYYPKNLKQVFDEKQNCFHINMVQKLSRQLVAAVIVLRNNNVVHSAIKPEHVLINHSLDNLKLCGFDECRSVDQVILLPNIGTPSYRAPELILGYSDGFSIDVWSTALVMYEMATGGRKLFPGMFNNDILYKQMSILGDIPFGMVQSSIYKDNHFFGTQFMRKQGYLGKDIIFICHFKKNNGIAQNIFNSYNKSFGRTTTNKEKIIDKKKYRMLVDLLNQMLILDPRQRLPIEFVYADPFIFETFNENYWLHG